MGYSFRCEHKIFSANLKRGPSCHKSPVLLSETNPAVCIEGCPDYLIVCFINSLLLRLWLRGLCISVKGYRGGYGIFPGGAESDVCWVKNLDFVEFARDQLFNNQLLRWFLCISILFLGYFSNYIVKKCPPPLAPSSEHQGGGHSPYSPLKSASDISAVDELSAQSPSYWQIRQQNTHSNSQDTLQRAPFDIRLIY